MAAAVAIGGLGAGVLQMAPHYNGGGNNSNITRRPNSSISNLQEFPLNGAKKKPKTFQQYLEAGARTYSCAHCRANLAKHTELISKSFQGSQGKAYLFNSVVNIIVGPAEERVLLTGLHAVADIKCECCKTVIGWKYDNGWDADRKRLRRSLS